VKESDEMRIGIDRCADGKWTGSIVSSAQKYIQILSNFAEYLHTNLIS
jgi:hypothetical protein